MTTAIDHVAALRAEADALEAAVPDGTVPAVLAPLAYVFQPADLHALRRAGPQSQDEVLAKLIDAVAELQSAHG